MWPGEILSLGLSHWLTGWNSAFTSWLSLSWQGRPQRMIQVVGDERILSLVYLSGICVQWIQPNTNKWKRDFQWCSHQCNVHHFDRALNWHRLKLKRTIEMYVFSIIFSNLLGWLDIPFRSSGGIPESLQPPTCTWESSIRKTQRPG